MSLSSSPKIGFLVPPTMHDHSSCKSYFQALDAFRADRLGLIVSAIVGVIAGSNVFTELRRNLDQNNFGNPILLKWIFLTVMSPPLVSTSVKNLLHILPDLGYLECQRGVEEMGSYKAYMDSLLNPLTPSELDDL